MWVTLPLQAAPLKSLEPLALSKVCSRALQAWSSFHWSQRISCSQLQWELHWAQSLQALALFNNELHYVIGQNPEREGGRERVCVRTWNENPAGSLLFEGIKNNLEMSKINIKQDAGCHFYWKTGNTHMRAEQKVTQTPTPFKKGVPWSRVPCERPVR